MKCPVCSAQMRRVGIEGMVAGRLVAEFECVDCHARIQSPIRSQ